MTRHSFLLLAAASALPLAALAGNCPGGPASNDKLRVHVAMHTHDDVRHRRKRARARNSEAALA